MIHIAFCTDDNYIMPTGVAMISVCENNLTVPITFHLVLTKDKDSIVGAENIILPLLDIAKKYEKEARIYNIDEKKLESYICTGASHISTTAFARVFLPEILSNDIHKVLYLDSDIICNGGLSGLWEIDLKDHPVGGVIDSNGTHPVFHQRLETPMTIPYINSGVLLMNLDSWRKNGYVAQLMECASIKKFPFLDQDTINYFFQDKIQLLPVKYNAQTSYLIVGEDKWFIDYLYLEEVREAMKKPVIVHYLSSSKPWTTAFCPQKEMWERYKEISVWKDLPPQKLITSFERTREYAELMDTYWYDSELFVKSILPFLRVFRVSVRFKNKNKIISIITTLLYYISRFLEVIYDFKVKK